MLLRLWMALRKAPNESNEALSSNSATSRENYYVNFDKTYWRDSYNRR